MSGCHMKLAIWLVASFMRAGYATGPGRRGEEDEEEEHVLQMARRWTVIKILNWVDEEDEDDVHLSQDLGLICRHSRK